MATIAEALDGRRNNFDVIRLAAALLVLFSHSYPLTGERFEPVYSLLGGYDTGGGWAVSIFFIISGFLVTQSVITRNLVSYSAARALRIFPALTVVVVLQVFVFGPLFTSLPLDAYFSSPRTYAYLQKASVFFGPGSLPGVFAENPLKSINGSLWTLSIELFFYGVLPILAFIGILGRPILLVVVALTVLYAIAVERYGLGWSNQGGKIFPGVPAFSAFKQGILFLSGSALWIYRDKVSLNAFLAVMCLCALIFMSGSPYKQYVFFLTLPYFVIYLALTRPFNFPIYDKIGDISYGVYIYAFPVQQAVVSVCGREIGPIGLTAIATPITLLFAYLSWVYVERSALRFRHKLLGRWPQTSTRSVSQPIS